MLVPSKARPVHNLTISAEVRKLQTQKKFSELKKEGKVDKYLERVEKKKKRREKKKLFRGEAALWK